MLDILTRLSVSRTMLLVVGLALVATEVPITAYYVAVERREIEVGAVYRADAALDMLEAVHVQSMLHRGRVEDGDPAIATLNGSMEQFSEVSRGVALWLVMGPKVMAFQAAHGATEIEGPLDPVDEAVIAQARHQRVLVDSVLRVSRPVVLGEGHAADGRCASCHTGLMGVGPGEVIGAYSAAVDLRAELAGWRTAAALRVVAALAVLVLTLGLIHTLLRVTTLRPLRRLAVATGLLAQGETDAELGDRDRADELGAMARALAVFRENLLARQRLERETAAAQSEALYLASHDALTGLPNRVLFAERLAETVAAVRRRTDGAAAVLCLDLDRFKEVNDTLGHAAGDELLREVAARLRACLRETDTAARLGGDEFAIVQTGLAQPADAEALCRRLLDVFAGPLRVMDQDVFVGLSVGVALVPEDGENAEALLKNADIALYRAKSEGRGTFRFFAPGMDAALQARKAIEHDLRAALARDQLRLCYQPLVDAAAGRMTGVEALLRWEHPERGPVSPAEFIPVAEATGLILPIGEWVLRTACAQAALWPGLTMAVNLSPVQFRHPDLPGLVGGVLDEAGLPAHRLELEITEGVLLHDTEAAVLTLDALRKLGVRISMDDFGTGYSSLSYLRRFPFDKIKIDQSFVRTLELDPGAVAIVRSVVGLGRSLGMVTTAEGVETAAQLDFLRREGCDQVQGYHLGRPQPASGIDRLLDARGANEEGLPLTREAALLPA